MSRSDDSNCVIYLKALSDKTRWEIMRVLSNSPEALNLGEISRLLDLSDYNTSRHVRILNEAGLVRVVRDGRFKRISVAPEWQSNWEMATPPGTLNLGCCSFDFSKPSKATPKP